jgi:PilZ domain
VLGLDADGSKWDEYVTTFDVSLRGARFLLAQPVERGQILLLIMAMPVQYRRYDPGQPLYRIYALVRHTRNMPDGQEVGVRLLGKNPPRDYERHPACRYFLPGERLPPDAPLHQQLDEIPGNEWGAPPSAATSEERRRRRRLDVFVDFRIHRIDASAAKERTVSENISPCGARLLTSQPIQPGEIVRIEEVDGEFATRAEVVNVYLGPDHTLRLNLRFIDGELPKRLLPDLPD